MPGKNEVPAARNEIVPGGMKESPGQNEIVIETEVGRE
jgi:hypothetical protein